ncbi:MAG: hypothetical protein ACR2MD_05005 [Aridibacter sp.]
MNYKDMSGEQLSNLNLSDEQLFKIHLEKGIEHAKIVLFLNANCVRKFGKSILSATQIKIFKKIAAGNFPNEEDLSVLEDADDSILNASILINEIKNLDGDL